MSRDKKEMSTFNREMQESAFKDAFDREYKEFALQELLLAMSEGDEKSVRTLAKEAGLHPNAVQNLRSGKTADVKLSTFLKIAFSYGYSLELVKGKKHIPVMPKSACSDEYSIVH